MLFLTLVLLAVAAPAGFVLAGEQSRPYIVVFNDDAVSQTVADSHSYLARPASAANPATSNGSRRVVDGTRVRNHVAEIQARSRIRIGNVFANALGGFSADLTPVQLRALQLDPAVQAVYPDEEIDLDDDGTAGIGAGGIRTTANPRVSVPAGVRRVGAERNTLARVDGRDTRVNADVAIIDTGIERDHPDLNVVGGYNCTGSNRSKWDDVDGHGTHVAGIVGALDNRIGVVGVAPGVRLWSVKVLGPHGSGRMSWLVCGIDWVTSQRERGNPSRALFEVANMSISYGGGKDRGCGKTDTDLVHEAICRSVAHGTVYVVAAGNESHNAKLNRPASYDEVITVSAMADYDGRGGGRATSNDSCPYWTPERDDAFTTFSNYGPDVDLIAPGRCVLSTYPRKRYAWMSGTSMAAPHVTGAAAVYRAMYPRATPQQVRMALQAVGTRDWRTTTDPDGVPEKAVWIGGFRTMPDFSTSAGAPGTLSAGGKVSLNLTINRVGGFEDEVSLAVVDPPTGLSVTPLSTTGTTATLDLTAERNVPAGRYVLTVHAVSGDIERVSVVTVTVTGSPPKATFNSVPAGISFRSSNSLSVSWTETTTAGPVVARSLVRQSGHIKTPGTCDSVRFATDYYSRSPVSPVAEQLASGYCYRWVVTLTDSHGNRGSTVSGSVLVDTTAPRAPSVEFPGISSASLDLEALGVDAAYLGHSGTLWVRGGSTGSVDLDVVGYDPESGVLRNNATLDRTSGWRASWVGDSAMGALQLSFSAAAADATLRITTTNRVGLTGSATVGHLMSDSDAPIAAQWVSAPSNTVIETTSTRFTLDWSASSDASSGLADAQWVVRYRAPLSDRGTCRSSAFTVDSSPALRTDGTTDSGLQSGACYVWGVRALDNVGNAAPVSWSGYVIVEGR
jgi:subtilisin